MEVCDKKRRGRKKHEANGDGRTAAKALGWRENALRSTGKNRAGPPEFAILGVNRAKKLPEKKIQPPPPYVKGSRPCGSTKFSAEMLNRSLMAAPRCARARCAAINTVSVDRQLRQSDFIEQFPYSLSGSPERFTVPSSPAGKGSVPDG
jgi:hypothetical protein